MKKHIFLLMLGIAAMLASCSQNEELTADRSGNLRNVTINLAADDHLQTRATVTINRYVMEVYESDGTTPANVFGGTNRRAQSTSAFTLMLDRTLTYKCLFWADNDAENIYNVENLKAVQLHDGNEAIENSFYGKLDVNGAIAQYDVTLHRAVAKIRLGEKDHIHGGSTLALTYTPNATFNVLDGTVTAAAGSETTKTIDISTDIDGSDDSPVEVGSFYLLAPTEGGGCPRTP